MRTSHSCIYFDALSERLSILSNKTAGGNISIAFNLNLQEIMGLGIFFPLSMLK